jgi:hypothetical protein
VKILFTNTNTNTNTDGAAVRPGENVTVHIRKPCLGRRGDQRRPVTALASCRRS